VGPLRLRRNSRGFHGSHGPEATGRPLRARFCSLCSCATTCLSHPAARRPDWFTLPSPDCPVRKRSANDQWQSTSASATTSTVRRLPIILMTLALAASTSLYGRATDGTADGPFIVGEVRSIAVDESNAAAIDHLHQRGWLRAGGQLLSVVDFPELYAVIGRAWTSKKADRNLFTIPDLCDRPAPDYGSVGDNVVTGGRILPPSPKLSHWIYVGHVVTTPPSSQNACAPPSLRRGR
jgi:hypothetical protein